MALGVLLALGVDEAREAAQRRELLRETRTALRTEALANRRRVIAKLETLAALRPMIESQPDQVGRYVRERRNRAFVPPDAAWTMAGQTGAVRWLRPEERMAFAVAYANQAWTEEVVAEEMARWFDLAPFERGRPGGAERRDAAIAVWRAWADRAYISACVQSARYEEALGGKRPSQSAALEVCLARTGWDHPSALYQEWERRGWMGKAGSPF